MMLLKDWRTKRNMSRAEAARALDVTESYYWKLEHGRVWPNAGKVAQIVRNTQQSVTANDLFHAWQMNALGMMEATERAPRRSI